VLDARKNKVYACLYRADGKNVKKLSKYLLLPLEDLVGKLEKFDSVFFLGDFAERAAAMLAGSRVATRAWHPRPETVGRLGLEHFRKKKFVSVEDLEPLYLYSKECDITGK
jgi:tRNA threonylcarbamoyladenosine biosynthesis protein TsaB